MWAWRPSWAWRSWRCSTSRRRATCGACGTGRAGRPSARRTWSAPGPEPATHVPPALPASQHQLPPTPLSEASVRKRKPLRERIRNVHIPQLRYIALTVAGVLVLGGAAYGAVRADQTATTTAARPAAPRRQARKGGVMQARGTGQRRSTSIRSQVTVAVLNGTTVQGLAATVGEEVAPAVQPRHDRQRRAHRPVQAPRCSIARASRRRRAPSRTASASRRFGPSTRSTPRSRARSTRSCSWGQIGPSRR